MAVAVGGLVLVAVGVTVCVSVGVAVGVNTTHWPLAPMQTAPNTSVLPPPHCPPVGGPHALGAWQQSCAPAVRVGVAVAVDVRVDVPVGVGVAVSVGVGVDVLVVVGVGVKATHCPVVPLQDAPYTGVPPAGQSPPTGGPHTV